MAKNNSTSHAHNFVDLTGKRFGSLTVVQYVETRGKVPYWHVLCDCGATNTVAGNNLRSGATRRCGHSCPLRIDPRTMDETGNVYGKLTVLGYAGRSLKTHKGAYWTCRCECGQELVVPGATLRNGATRSCSAGCGHTTHGMRSTREYWCWRDIKARCNKSDHPGYQNYGGRGIKVCERWRDSFENFFADMGLKPFEGASIGRINNDGDYTPDNCRWETPEQQQNNRRNCRYITYQGDTLTLTQWARRIGVHKNTLAARLKKGWPLAKAMTRDKYTRSHKRVPT